MTLTTVHHVLQSLKYLRQEDLPCTRTTAKSMQRVLQEMEAVKPNPCDDPRVGTFGLTKAEKLMCVNLMPKSVLDLMIVGVLGLPYGQPGLRAKGRPPPSRG